MSRLTTNKPVDEMSMLELAHNSCYAEDGKARYRDFEMDMDARDFARNLLVTLTGEELPIDDEAFDEEMHDNLQYDQFSNVKGLIALFYRNLWAMADLRETLKVYEDKEEQGLLPKLPFKVGGTVYRLTASKNAYYKTKVSRITIYEDSIWVSFFNGKGVSIKEIGKTVFLTEAAAEEALAKMGE